MKAGSQRPDLPIATGDIWTLRQTRLLYVDKTRYIAALVQPKNQFAFLARPRRFGKSLLVSTLEALFQGERALFADTWIHDQDRDWTPHPVIRLDMAEWHTENAASLKEELMFQMEALYVATGETPPPRADTGGRLLSVLIQRLAARGPKVVVLIDEYDAPILQNLERHAELTGIRDVLRGFYGVLKANSRYLRFVFLTGVTRFARTSLFSGLNNLKDISYLPEFSALAGFTEEELDRFLTPYVEDMARARGTSADAVRQGIRRWYDGYLFAEDGARVYNPYSTLQCLNDRQFAHYWSDSGTPAFLTQLIRSRRENVQELVGQDARDIRSAYYGWKNPDLHAVMFQTGYLTLRRNPETQRYVTAFPNREVEQAFLTSLLADYAQAPHVVRKALDALTTAVQRDDYASFTAQFNALLTRIPYEIHLRKHQYYQSLLHLTFTLMGFRTGSEISTHRARMDTIVELPNKVVILEYKLDGAAEDALRQIEAKGYHLPYLAEGRPVIGLGVNFDRKRRAITEWKLQTYAAE